MEGGFAENGESPACGDSPYEPPTNAPRRYTLVLAQAASLPP